ncbi:tRNA (adenosine(37)-N6)-threonylcarbamoyltransferase complex ATPase subunit type 1 TsaE [Lujinxingia sediminis]|uniref:tRNA threonylcarbamoyladenosine biosynthesis protein TsaE n=1 Tax=Lujinxingia sediminis TaxID=2480984 RepID=A0ABY0CXX4_9DELT|nr:tRNA (adenosine(37)-N6)-threonylcarbamoyltransferase complex ATPase subunit type 1 TsaE [Lujinxingia sediminis]RVU48738.1 tRNA (adenosine(37)-N6)-threonylcarbamoyltransferase complex ATPase subunit type 1 TsaE [Lujinxingia sediminis]
MTTRERPSFDPGEYTGLIVVPRVELALDGEAATLHLGRALGRGLHERGEGFLGLVGDLGAGKTTLIKGLAEGMSIAPDEVSSPTYALVQEYGRDAELVHMDLYRLEHVDDLESLAYWDYIDRPETLVCVEWLDRIPHAWPGQGVIVELGHRGEGRQARIFASEAFGSLVDRVGSKFDDIT